MEKYIVEAEEQGKRLDMYISSKDEELTRTSAQRLIEQGDILVNNKKVKVAYKVSEGDIIAVEKQMPKEIEIKAQNIPVDIVYEDDDIIVVNKPKGKCQKYRQINCKDQNSNRIDGFSFCNAPDHSTCL